MRHITVLAGCLLWFGSLATPSPAAEARRLKVVASFLPVYCFTVNVAGDLAEVECLLPAGVAPHDYQLSPRDLRRLAAADLIVVNGLEMESWLDKVFRSSVAQKSRTIMEASAGLKTELISEGEEASAGQGTGKRPLHVPLSRPAATLSPPGGERAGRGDAYVGFISSTGLHKRVEVPHSHVSQANPHFWLDPRLAARAVTNIALALQTADPANAAGYARQAARYVQRLEHLDAELCRTLAPLKHHGFVTLHNAFPYFVRRYDLALVGIIEEVPEVQPSAKHVVELLRRMREKQAKAIFTEPQSTSALAEQLGRDLNLPVAALDPLETGPLTATAYEAGLRRNLDVLRKHLK